MTAQAAMSEYLRYALRDDHATILLKPNGFMSGYRFLGTSFLGSSWERLTALADGLSMGVSPLDNQWCLHIESFRRPGAHYPTTGVWPSRELYYLDLVRRFRFEEDGVHYNIEGRAWLSYFPRRPRTSWWAELIGRHAEYLAGPAETFAAKRREFEGAASQYLRNLERMDVAVSPTLGVATDPAMRALRECIIGQSGEIACDLSEPIFLDGVLSEPVEKTEPLMVGGSYVSVYSIWGFPQYVFPNMLAALQYVPGTLRYGIRIMPLSGAQAEATFSGLSRIHSLSALGPGLLNARGVEEDRVGSSWRADARYGRDLSKGGRPFATVYCYVVGYADSMEALAEQDGEIERALRDSHVVFRREREPHNFEAFRATLPGEIDANDVRVSRLTVSGAMRVAPIISTYQGPTQHPHRKYGPDAAPLLMMTTRTREPFRFFHHVGEVGHTLFIAPTGVGKSYMLRTMESAHLARYPGARVLALDIGYSAFKLPHFIGGNHFEASVAAKRQIAFLEGLYDAPQFEEINANCVDLAEACMARSLSADERHDLREALRALGTQPARLSDLASVCQFRQLQDTFRDLKDSFLDAVEDGFDFDSPVPYWVFEYGALGRGENRWTTAFFLHVQRRVSAFLERVRPAPTLFTMDEAGQALGIRRAARIAEIVEREGRKHMMSFIFACQSSAEVVNSSIREVLITQTKTKMCGAIPEATSPIVRNQLSEIGFSDDAIDKSGHLQQHEILVENELGTQIVRMLPVPVELALCGNASNDDRDLVRSLMAEHGPSGWMLPYLETYGPEMEPFIESYRALSEGRQDA